MSTRLADFDFDLPPERIARNPVHPRDQSRLLVLERDTGRRHDSVFTELCRWLSPGDLLVVNTTQVIPARLQVHKPTGGAVELLFIEPVEGG